MKFIKLASPDIRPSDIRRVIKVLRSGNLVQGPTVARFESALGRFAGTGNCAAVSSGTAALHLALLALGIGNRDSVIVPAFTYPATANVVEQVGGKVILCDVDPASYVMTPETLRSAVSRRKDSHPSAVIVVHEFGYPADMAGLCAVAREHGMKVIEDAACALGTRANGAHVGHFGDAAGFSFHPRKAVTTGEGGAVVSRRTKTVRTVKELRNHGIRIDRGKADFVAAGLNYRMTEFQAALAIGQLGRFERELQRRKRLAAQYLDRLSGVPHISLPRDNAGSSWQTFMLVLDANVDRSTVISRLADRGIQSNLGAQAINALSYYRSKYGWTDASCPVATRLYRHGLALPLHGAMTLKDVRFVSDSLAAALAARSRNR